MAALPPFGPGPALTEWALDPGPALGVAVAGGAYAWGILRLRQRGRGSGRGRRWPAGRTVSFGAGLLVIVLATQSSMGVYDTSLFSLHVAQHILLGIAAPFCLALGAPVTLALQASDRITQINLLRVIRSRPVRVLTNPIVAFVVFSLTLYALYFTPVYELSLRNDWVHSTVHLHFLVAGSLFFWVVIGLDPIANRIPYGARLGLVLLTVPFHAFVGIALMQGSVPLAADWYAEVRDWGVSPLTDQRTGAALMWGLGDLVGLIAGGVVLGQWMAHESRVNRRAERAETRASVPVAAPPVTDAQGQGEGQGESAPFHTETAAMGVSQINLDRALQVAAELDDDELVRKMRSGK